jgi:MFS transporter, UMF1 family
MKKEVFAWALYDLANTAFSSLFVTFFFPVFVKVFLGGNEIHIALVFGVSMFFTAIVVPFIGAFSDSVKKRMPFLIFFTLVCILATFLVPFFPLFAVLIIGGIANFSYHSALAVYNALIPKISEKKDYGKISGIGVGFGYAGNFLSIGLAALVLSYFGWDSLEGIKFMFFLTAGFFLFFSLFSFLFIKEKKISSKRLSSNISYAFSSVKKTLSNIKKNLNLVYYIVGVFFVMNAISAAIIFLYLFGRDRIGLSIPEYMVVFCLFSVTAVFGAVFFGRLSDKIGSKKSLVFSVFLWCIVILVLVFVSNFFVFIFAGLLGGVAWGAFMTCARPLLLEISPKNKVAEFFGFSELANKFSGIIGPIAFSILVVFWNYSAALLLLLLFFIVGGFFIQKCRVR